VYSFNGSKFDHHILNGILGKPEHTNLEFIRLTIGGREVGQNYGSSIIKVARS
jgi:K+/H+ antiporter YhaU regulatory subunit KhtT